MDRMRGWCDMIGTPYFRLSSPLCRDIPLDETDDAVIVDMLWDTLVYMRHSAVDVDMLMDLLR